MKFEYQIIKKHFRKFIFNEEISNYFDGLTTWPVAIFKVKLTILHLPLCVLTSFFVTYARLKVYQ